MATLPELYQHEREYLHGLDKLTPAPAQEADPVAAAAQDIQATVDHLAQEETGDLEDTKEMPGKEELEAGAAQEDEEEAPGGLYSDLTAAFAQQEPGTEHARHRSDKSQGTALRTSVVQRLSRAPIMAHAELGSVQNKDLMV